MGCFNNKDDRNLQIASIIKSNLVSDGINPEIIRRISEEMLKDIIDILDAYDDLINLQQSKNGDEYVD